MAINREIEIHTRELDHIIQMQYIFGKTADIKIADIKIALVDKDENPTNYCITIG